MLEGIIVKNISNTYTVLCGNKRYDCTPRGKFRKEKIVPLVGDKCLFDQEHCYIMEIMPRKNELQRPNVSNVDVGLIVTSMKSPEYNSTLLDKEISSILLSHVQPIICFTKIDLLSDAEISNFKEIKSYYEKIGIRVFDNQNLAELKRFLQGKLVVLTGQSGSGKSTLLNKIAPELNLKTNEISNALNRGKHTTRHIEIFDIEGISFFDTPGFSSLSLEYVGKEEIRDTFIEFSFYPCKFKDCMHLKEKDCGVRNAVDEHLILSTRYESYQKMLVECKK